MGFVPPPPPSWLLLPPLSPVERRRSFWCLFRHSWHEIIPRLRICQIVRTGNAKSLSHWVLADNGKVYDPSAAGSFDWWALEATLPKGWKVLTYWPVKELSHARVSADGSGAVSGGEAQV